MKKPVLLVLFFMCAALIKIHAQEKKHFKIIIHDITAKEEKYEKASSNFLLDEFRYYDKRRVVDFTDGKASIEIYSAKELLEAYEKEIAPGTIFDPTKARQITFDITLDGNTLKPQLIQ
jgi:hypothetical protein